MTKPVRIIVTAVPERYLIAIAGPCECPAAQAAHVDHRTVSFQTPGCWSRWYKPRHQPTAPHS